jgi:SNF2 family DNA or RNA helicase
VRGESLGGESVRGELVPAGTRVLHGFVGRDGAINLWAETDASSGARSPEHPFAVEAGRLPSGEARRPATLVLPSTSAGPIPSPLLGLPPRKGKPRLRAWRVPAVTVPFVDDELADEFDGRVAPSLAWLIELCGFAADLVRRGRVLPSVRPGASDVGRGASDVGPGASDAGRGASDVRRGAPDVRPGAPDAGLHPDATETGTALQPAGGGGRWQPGPSEARWRPVITGLDAAHHGELLKRLPAAVRAERARPGDLALLPAQDILHAALERLVDMLVRMRLAEAAVDIGDGWLAALTGEPGFAAAPGLVDELTSRLDAWHGDAVSGAAVRLCFRLSHVDDQEDEEPDATDPDPDRIAPDDAWLLEFLLQAVDEPSALVTAADVWQDHYAPLRRWTRHPQERLLGGLGRAARLYPDLDAALHVPRPVDMVLDTEEAHRFLAHAAALEEAGYGVLLPRWWRERRGLGLALEVRPRDPIAPVLRDRAADLATIVDYRWGLALGGDPLTETELKDLAKAKVPLVKLRGRWVYLDEQHLQAGLRFLGRGGGSMTAGDALRTVRLLPPETLPLPVTASGGEGWVADLLAGDLARQLELLDQPEGLVGELRAYQKRGFSWLAFLDGLGVGACLADDMGLGKTVQLLALLLHRRAGPALLICPLSVLGNWQREAARFAPSLKVTVLHGADRPAPGELAGADVVLTTYTTATLDADELAAIRWDRVVLDEAQHIKNAASAVARAVRRLPARSRIALTGTPVENRLAELWSIMDFLNPGVLANAHVFRARFAVPVERYADEDAAARLRRATRPFLLRRVKSDPTVISDLPEKRVVRHLCGLTAEQATLYRAVLDEMTTRLREARDTWNKGIVLAAMTKLKQACVHPALLLGDGSPLPGRSGKLERLEEIVDGVLAAGESVLCFTQFARFGTMLTPHLAGRFGVPVRYLYGGTSRSARDEMVASFQADDRPGIFVLSLKAGGTGINLTRANHVVHVDRWWNPATEAQATDRAYRIGQQKDVRVHTLVCLGTLEERIDRLLVDKGVLAARVVGNGEGWLTTLSTTELRDLLVLEQEAIGD